MKNILVLTISLLSLSAFAQRYATNVIENVDYEIIEETNLDQESVLSGDLINYRTVRLTDHKKKENGVINVVFDWKSYYLEIDKDLFRLPKDGGVKSTKLKDIVITEQSCKEETLTIHIQTKTIDPIKYDQAGVLRLTKLKSKSLKINAKKYCNGFMPSRVVFKTL